MSIPVAYDSSNCAIVVTPESAPGIRYDKSKLVCRSCDKPVLRVKGYTKRNNTRVDAHFKHRSAVDETTCTNEFARNQRTSIFDDEQHARGEIGEWHRFWTNGLANTRFCEVHISKSRGKSINRADVLNFDKGVRIEIQYSPISQETIRNRMEFVGVPNLRRVYGTCTIKACVWLFHVPRGNWSLKRIIEDDSDDIGPPMAWLRFYVNWNDTFTGVLSDMIFLDVGTKELVLLDMHGKCNSEPIYKATLVQMKAFIYMYYGGILRRSESFIDSVVALRPSISNRVEIVSVRGARLELKEKERLKREQKENERRMYMERVDAWEREQKENERKRLEAKKEEEVRKEKIERERHVKLEKQRILDEEKERKEKERNKTKKQWAIEQLERNLKNKEKLQIEVEKQRRNLRMNEDLFTGYKITTSKRSSDEGGKRRVVQTKRLKMRDSQTTLFSFMP